MNVDKFLDHPISIKWGGRGNSGIVHWANVLDDLCFQNCSVLLIGTGWEYEQYYDWPTILRDVWNAKCSYLEIDSGYINKWRNGPFPLYEGSVSDIKNIISKNFDVILWVQGPEHIPYKDMLSTFEDMFKKSNRGIVCTCPWGSYYDYQGVLNNNPSEQHIQKSMDENTFGPEFSNYHRLFGGIKDSGNGQILIWRKYEDRS